MIWKYDTTYLPSLDHFCQKYFYNYLTFITDVCFFSLYEQNGTVKVEISKIVYQFISSL